MSQKYEKLKTLLKELFQLDQPELDFGIYRIMHARSAEVTQFLDKELLPQVKQAFAQYRTADKAELEKELAKAIEAVDTGALEAEVYDHLYSFFRRYYSEGDFLSKRVYKPGVYAIPYEGEEVKLHWANADQYYIKTSESFRDYAFRLRPEDEANPMRVHFRLADAAEGEHGNVKEQADKERRFRLAPAPFAAIEDGELVIRFTYEPDPAKQKDLNAEAEAAILALDDPALADWIKALGGRHVRADGTASENTRLRVHLDRYTARNTFDYFIHKDLGGFLRRELDFYIKNEVMHLDDVESETAPRVEQYLSKIKVIRRIAHKIIDFLAQLEDFQKKLWLKKKFVVETSYCITLDRVPEELWPEVAANEKQWDQWKKLGVWGGDAPGTLEDLKAAPYRMVDTSLFDKHFARRLMSSLENFDDHIDGLLIQSENFQAVRFLNEKFRKRVDLVYFDPPYNTDATPILYKNGYKDSSWATLLADRIESINVLLTEDDGVTTYAIDDTEASLLKEIIKQKQPDKDIFQCIVEHYPGSGTGRSNVSRTHEYCIFSVPKDADILRGDAVKDGIRIRGFRRAGTGDNNFRIGNPGRPDSFFAVLVDKKTFEVKGVEPPPYPAIQGNYPLEDTPDGLKRVYPIGENGEERVWSLSYEGAKKAIENGLLISSRNFVISRIYHDNERRLLLPSIWQGNQYNATTGGTNLLTSLFGRPGLFPYPKSIGTMERILESALHDKNESITFDLFAGSGTTAHAVINRNRKLGSNHKYLLVEMGSHSDSVIKQRIAKVVYSADWLDGKPKNSNTGISHCLNVIRLESYEDTLNNLELRRIEAQQRLLDSPQAQGADGFREQYLLRYMLDVETRGSQSLLNVSAFMDPTAYKLKVKRPGSDESREVNVDLLETFNWLIGLKVDHIAAPRTYSAAFRRDDDPDLPADAPRRLLLDGRLKEGPEGPWWFRTVTGTTPDGRRTLVIWRKRPGGEEPEGIERDNLVLDEWFRKQGYSSKDSEFDLIYVNGDNNLENLKAPDDTWKVRLIEEDFFRLMFEMGGT